MDVVTVCEQTVRGKGKSRGTNKEVTAVVDVRDGRWAREIVGRDDKWLGLGCICSRTWRTY